ncbi:IS66 family transposase [Thorsellia kenyensis]|uniref:Transposase n=1 Tax=Thorsellia kenyensis TaxID=1549888 RepID=A0ABV6C8A1_9GAMM
MYYHCTQSHPSRHLMDMLAKYGGKLSVYYYFSCKTLFNYKPILDSICTAHVHRKFGELAKIAPNPTVMRRIFKVIDLKLI